MAGNNRKTTTGTSGLGNPTKIVRISEPDLRKFLVHFRRPLKAGYDGSYGFDWLRDEYVYDIEPVFEANDISTKLYRGNVEELIKEYTCLKSSDANNLKEVDEIITEDKETYLPAWLAIFPTSSPININGVDLHLQIDQEIGDDTNNLTADGTVLEFETSTGVVVSPNQIALGEVINKKLPPRTLVAIVSSK